jgi:hypothetical protein
MSLVSQQTIGAPTTAAREDFSLVLGGPLYQLLLRFKLIEPHLGHIGKRIGIITAIVWLPLAVLTILEARFAGNVKVPFLSDCEVQARLLFALPLLVLAELLVYVRMRTLTEQFVERKIITDDLRPAFDGATSSAMRLRNSVLAEVALLVLVAIVGPGLWRDRLALHSDTWYTASGSSGLTLAGYWYAYVDVPIFQFILLRWYYRIAIWCRYLYQVSRLDLNLVALHPDRSCGLGFLGTVVFSFAPLLMAHSGLVAGYIGNRILQQGASLPDFKFEIVGLASLLLAIVLGPLCVFTPKLNRARLAGLRSYGALASDYVVSFADKWTRGRNPENDRLLGSGDIQSLADLTNSFAVVREVKLIPFDKETIVRFLVVIAVPLSPLVFTMFSPEELLRRLVHVLL